MEPQQLLLSIDELQNALGGLGRTSAYDLIKRGLIVKVNIGRRSFVTAKSVEEYVDRLAEAALDVGGAA